MSLASAAVAAVLREVGGILTLEEEQRMTLKVFAVEKVFHFIPEELWQESNTVVDQCLCQGREVHPLHQ